MKKTLLLSVVASTMIMAGGTIAPVEPVVETPAPVAEASGWDFSGQAVVYYQTSDAFGNGDLFEQATSIADAGLKLGAVNKDLFGGIGAGVEVNGLTTLGLEHSVVSNVMEAFGSKIKGGWISQAYLTYAAGNTSFKVGRQELPKSLSPFAFSEGWNVFKNSFDAALVVNTDLPSTTLVGAWVHAANSTAPFAREDASTDISQFGKLNENDGVYMLTAQNKAIDGLTLTGTYYLAPDLGDDDLSIIWGDAKFAAAGMSVGLQGGTVLAEDIAPGLKDTTAFGAKLGASFAGLNTSIAYSSVDDGSLPIHNVGTGVKTPLYTQMILNQGIIKSDTDYIKAGVSTKALGGKLIANYGYAVEMRDNDVDTGSNPAELDLIYKTKVFNGSTTLLAAYVMVDPDVDGMDNLNVIRLWGRYNF